MIQYHSFYWIKSQHKKTTNLKDHNRHSSSLLVKSQLESFWPEYCAILLRGYFQNSSVTLVHLTIKLTMLGMSSSKTMQESLLKCPHDLAFWLVINKQTHYLPTKSAPPPFCSLRSRVGWVTIPFTNSELNWEAS